jgi:transketolase
MRKQFVKTVSEVLEIDNNTALLLGDIGVYGFREEFKKYPNRVYNVGVLEQSMIGMAAGMSLNGMTPIVHTIAPFLVERAYEQLKIDFGYNDIGGNFVSIGASYDYAALGATHHCPADVHILKQIPNMQIVVPGNSKEFDELFKLSYNNRKPTYFRLSEYENELFDNSRKVKFGEPAIINCGTKKEATIVVVGNMLDRVLEAVENIDVTILYYTTLQPFDYDALCRNWNENIIIVEPYYTGGLLNDVISNKRPARYLCIGEYREFVYSHGTFEEQTKYERLLSVEDINCYIQTFLYRSLDYDRLTF